jgi:hypothetical protein
LSWTYSCPACSAMLNPDQSIILVGEHGAVRALVGFHPEPGNFEVYLPPGVAPEAGTRWSFYCPVCHHDLAAGGNTNLCALLLHAGGRQSRLLFSRVAGDQATFVVSDQGVEARHGRDVEKYWAAVATLKYVL